MRVLLIIHTTGHGGAENIFRWLACELHQLGFEVIAAVPQRRLNEEYWIGPALQDLGVPWEVYDASGDGVKLFQNLYGLIKKIRPDVVHSHLLDSNFYAAVACKLLSVPHVCTEHGDIAIKRSWETRIKAVAVVALANVLVCVSEAVRKHVEEFVNWPKSNAITIPNGIAVSHSVPTVLRKEFTIAQETLVVGSVGNLYPIKGHSTLVQAFSRLLNVHEDACLVFVGRGSEYDNLREEVLSLRIPQEKVIFTGFRNDVQFLLQDFDIYVQPSISEGMPLALLEALSAGVPVIATTVGGMPEVFSNGIPGYLVPPKNVKEMSQALISVAREIKFYKQRASDARLIVQAKYSLEAMTNKYVGVYKDIFDKRHPRWKY